MLQEVALLLMRILHLVQLNSEYHVLVALPYHYPWGHIVYGMDNYREVSAILEKNHLAPRRFA